MTLGAEGFFAFSVLTLYYRSALADACLDFFSLHVLSATIEAKVSYSLMVTSSLLLISAGNFSWTTAVTIMPIC